MALVPGTKLGPYEILAPLGAGGMGEVYRARDTRLGREVAIKTLPAEFARDADRRNRFETESKAVASLSHPNVLALHDVGSEGDVTFAVMELVPGQTLRERLLDGPLPRPRALALAVQLAHGLGAAHDRGVVHRDLKPENVIVTPDGRAKILDFGLARLAAPAAEGSASLAPTLAAATLPGAVLGTTAYMAPEQVRGLPADARSDIFALGVVMYEMLAGRQPFRGESPADTMTAILREDPAPLATLVADLPPALERIVARCLEKHPGARFRSASDLAFALEAVSTGSGSAVSGVPASAPPASAALRFQRLTYRNGVVSGARFAPGGSGIVFGASWEGRPFEVFTCQPGSPEARSLGLPPANLLSVSPQGDLAISLGHTHTFWHQASGTLARTALAGGGVRPLQKGVGQADWSPDGRTLALVRYVEGSARLEYPAGVVRYDTSDWVSRPSVSRDGTRVAFAAHPYLGDTTGNVCVVGPEGAARVVASGMNSISGIAWSASGEEIWVSGINDRLRNGIWAFREGAPPREIYTSPARVSLHDVARDGRVLISLGNLRLGLAAGERGHQVELSWFDGSVVTDLSADGKQVLFFEGHEAENPHYACYLRDVDGSPAVRLGEGTSMRLSPGGEWALALTHAPEHQLWLYPTGLGESREIRAEGIERFMWVGFHPDGAQLFAVGYGPDRVRRVFRFPLAGGRAEVLWEEPITFDRVQGLPATPDGERLVLRRASGETVMLTPRTGDVAPVPGIEPNDHPLRIDATGRYLFVSRREAGHREVLRLDLESGLREPWGDIAPLDPTGVLYVGNPALSADGSSFAYSYYRHLGDLYLVEGLA